MQRFPVAHAKGAGARCALLLTAEIVRSPRVAAATPVLMDPNLAIAAEAIVSENKWRNKPVSRGKEAMQKFWYGIPQEVICTRCKQCRD